MIIFSLNLKNIFFALIIPRSVLAIKLVVAVRRIKFLWTYLFCKKYHSVNYIAFFYAFNYYTLNFPAHYFSFEIFLSKLTSVMTFSFLVILLSFWCNTFKAGVFRIEYCFEKTVLSVILFIGHIKYMKYNFCKI